MITALLAFAVCPFGGETPAPAPLDLVVHEWGTFTSMQGSDGVTLEGLHHEEAELPRFVYQLDDAGGLGLEMGRTKGIARRVRGVTVKMETPVTYFYSPRALALHAQVELKHGLLSQWYPFAHATEDADKSDVLDFTRVRSGALAWDIELLAPKLGFDDVPMVDAGDPWACARIPRSNCVRVEVAAVGDAPARSETEQFLFYRGLARFDLPIRATVSAGAKLRIDDTSKVGDALTHLFVLHVRDGHGEYSYVSRIDPGMSVDVVRTVGADSPSVDAMVASLAPELTKALAASGLFEDEARAMVETWKTSYFHTPGLRVLYVLPQRFTDELLPLRVHPAPRAQVRVLVGRLECVTPEVEDAAEGDLRAFCSDDSETSSRAWERLQKHARYLEPIVRRVAARTTDADVRARIAMLLEWL